jgi:hypothetical protein
MRRLDRQQRTTLSLAVAIITPPTSEAEQYSTMGHTAQPWGQQDTDWWMIFPLYCGLRCEHSRF